MGFEQVSASRLATTLTGSAFLRDVSYSLLSGKRPDGVTVVLSGRSRDSDIPYKDPPRISLGTQDPAEILDLLGYPGIHYRQDSEAAQEGVQAFIFGRDDFVLGKEVEEVTFDWDHTLSNYQIFDNLWSLMRTKLGKKRPPEARARLSMTAIESPRPLMQELAFGMMAGFALKQGLTHFDQWKSYQPKVGLATHTWPDRIGVLARWFVPLLSLMEGLLPGEPNVYEQVTASRSKAFLPLPDFLDYAEDLMRRFDEQGFGPLTPQERKEALAYLKDGKAHYRKPIGAFVRKGWSTKGLIHFDDSLRVNEDLHGIFVRNPYSSKPDRDVGELKKISLPGLWRSHDSAVMGVAETLARVEAVGSTFDAIQGALRLYPSPHDYDLTERSRLPDGIVLMMYETPTTLGEFWENYVKRPNGLKKRIKDIRKRHGGVGAIRGHFETFRAA